MATAGGYLTFERFVAGLRTSLLSANCGPQDPTCAPARPGVCAGQRATDGPGEAPAQVQAARPTARSSCAPQQRRRPAPRSLSGPRARAPTQVHRPAGPWRRTQCPRGNQRHTITTGMDCGLLKQMKELQQEEVLLQGLEMMAETRLVPAAATSAGAPVLPGSEHRQRRLWGCREPPPTGAATAQGTGGGSVPGRAAGCGLCQPGPAYVLLRAPPPCPDIHLVPGLTAADYPYAEGAEPTPHPGGDRGEWAHHAVGAGEVGLSSCLRPTPSASRMWGDLWTPPSSSPCGLSGPPGQTWHSAFRAGAPSHPGSDWRAPAGPGSPGVRAPSCLTCHPGSPGLPPAGLRTEPSTRFWLLVLTYTGALLSPHGPQLLLPLSGDSGGLLHELPPPRFQRCCPGSHLQERQGSRQAALPTTASRGGLGGSDAALRLLPRPGVQGQLPSLNQGTRTRWLSLRQGQMEGVGMASKRGVPAWQRSPRDGGQTSGPGQG